MADSKIADLTANTSPVGTEELVVNDSTNDRKIAVNNLAQGLTIGPRKCTLHNNRYFFSFFNSTAAPTSSATTANIMNLTPIYISNQTVTRIGIYVLTGAASTSVRLGIYESNADERPGDLLLDAGTVDSSTSGEKEITISEALNGIYWLASVPQGGTPTLHIYGTGHVGTSQGPVMGATTGSGAHSTGYLVTGVSGALPDPVGTLIYGANTTLHRPWLRVV